MADILEFYSREEMEYIYKLRRLNINPKEFLKLLMAEVQQDDNFMEDCPGGLLKDSEGALYSTPDDYPGLTCSNCGKQIILGIVNDSNERNIVLCRVCNIISRKN